MKYSGIGGEAVLEGIMMRNKTDYAVACRKEDGEIAVTKESYVGLTTKLKVGKVPFIRGIFAFIDSLVLGLTALNISASYDTGSGEKGDSENGAENSGQNGSKDSGKGGSKNGGALTKGETVLTMVIAVILAIGIFVVLPALLSSFLKRWIESNALRALFEGLFRLALFIGYILLITLMPDIRRTFMYHGSEHKCINCIEHGLPLTVDNVMQSSKEHKRCGTSFILIVFLISIILFMFIQVDHIGLKILTRILLIPVIAGISFEILQFTGRHDGTFVRIISRPGMWMQALTTKEPTPDMAEVAIQAVEAVFDWKAFLKENFGWEEPEDVHDEA